LNRHRYMIQTIVGYDGCFSKSFLILQQIRVVDSFTIFRGLGENLLWKVSKLRETYKSFGKIYKKCQEIPQKKKDDYRNNWIDTDSQSY
jgi:hypothetical protein